MALATDQNQLHLLDTAIDPLLDTMSPVASKTSLLMGKEDELLFQSSKERVDDAPQSEAQVATTSQHPQHRNDEQELFRDSKSSLVNLAIREYAKASLNAQPDADQAWLLKREVPSTTEVLGTSFEGKDGDPPHNNVEDPWPSKEAYLNTHYSILREDLLRPIRSAIKTYRGNPEMNDDNDLHIYQNVYIKGFVFADVGLGVRVCFSAARSGKKILWNQSKRLRQGTMLAMTTATDRFKTICKLVTVAGRPLIGLQMNPPEIEIFFGDPSEIEIDPQEEWLMVEARMGYFEAYRHTLVALQRMAAEKFPLAEQILGIEKKVPLTEQLKRNPVMNVSSAFSEGHRESKSSVNVVENWPKHLNSDLDESQMHSLRRLATKQLALIQGPPGTGKTRTSVAGLRVLLDTMAHNDPPIIVASQTNHALDQLLRHISIFESNFIRLGSRTNDREVVKPRSLFVIRQGQRIKLDGGLKQEGRSQLTKAMNFLKGILSPFCDITEPVSANVFRKFGLLSDAQYRSLEEEDDQWIRVAAEARSPMVSWLRGCIEPMLYKHVEDDNTFVTEESDPEFEQLREQEAENGGNFPRDDEEETETLKGPYYSIFEPFRACSIRGVTKKALDRAFTRDNLWEIPEQLRAAMYARLVALTKRKILTMFRNEAEAYTKAVDTLKIGRWEENEVFLRRAKVIGATTTGLSKYRGLVASLKPKIMIIEEAAETMEAMVVAGCVSSINHLILVGDHKQLQSQAVMPEFRKKPFNMNISLFERLVMNGVEYSVLTQQRRMRPEISRLLSPIYGSELQDHPSVRGRVHIRGMAQNCAFFDHNFPESADESLSKLNYREAEMIVGHYEHLFYNGVRADQITVLTFYNGQRKLLLRMLRARASLNGNIFKVATVDSFQGEENLVILLSLVRSNFRDNIGFLAVPNRVTVALSRAQYGFYIFGNITNLVSISSIWWDTIASIPEDKLDDQPRPFMHILCSRHNNNVLVHNPEGWRDLKGGCRQKCEGVLQCGHYCKLPCHPFEHTQILCEEPCSKQLPCGHQCKNKCGKECKCFCRALPSAYSAPAVRGRAHLSAQPKKTSRIIPVRNTANSRLQKRNHTHALGPVMNGVQRLRWTATVTPDTPGGSPVIPSSNESWTEVSIPTTTSAVALSDLVDTSIPAVGATSEDLATTREILRLQAGIGGFTVEDVNETEYGHKIVTASGLAKSIACDFDGAVVREHEYDNTNGYGTAAMKFLLCPVKNQVGVEDHFEIQVDTEASDKASTTADHSAIEHSVMENLFMEKSVMNHSAMDVARFSADPLPKNQTRNQRKIIEALAGYGPKGDEDLISF